MTSNLPVGKKLDACLIKSSKLAEDYNKILGGYLVNFSKDLLETIYATRLPRDTYRGILNIVEAARPNAPNDEVEKALVSEQRTNFEIIFFSLNIKINGTFHFGHFQEYFYDDVPKCSK